jgi:hypothetical protein
MNPEVKKWIKDAHTLCVLGDEIADNKSNYLRELDYRKFTDNGCEYTRSTFSNQFSNKHRTITYGEKRKMAFLGGTYYRCSRGNPTFVKVERYQASTFALIRLDNDIINYDLDDVSLTEEWLFQASTLHDKKLIRALVQLKYMWDYDSKRSISGDFVDAKYMTKYLRAFK